ncbi:41438_t:CDS:2, partial [Gigaspora margarita]
EISQVDDCYHALFEQNSKEVFWVSIIARTAFSMSKTVLCKDKLMKRRISQYLVSVCYISFYAKIMNSELAGRPAAERVRQSSPEPEPEPEPVP